MKLYAGTYEGASKPGIHRFRYDAASGAVEYEEGYAGVERPSFLIANRGGTALYAVSEQANGEVHAFAIRPDGSLAPLGARATGGADPCHLALSADEKRLFVSNYSGGSVAVFPVLPDGSLGERASLSVHEGKGARPDRQEGPHPHAVYVAPGGRRLIVPDLGIDRLVVYDVTADAFERTGTIGLPDGAGPRHMAFHPTLPVAYVVNELASSVSTFVWEGADPSAATPRDHVTTLPDEFDGENYCADIHVSSDGRFVYASNRGHDSLAIYRAEAEGRLAPAGFAPIGARTPRNFAIAPDGRHVLAAAQDSDAIVVFAADAATGGLEETYRYDGVRRPVCLAFA
ncbi:MAG TPA: lactonase family protein [Paenibacillus sp.]|nr:lactonase family protein [Paenibacillus sp.]